MIVFRDLPKRPLKFRNPVVAIGIFDGVHRGHQVILKRAVERARRIQGTPIAITFDPHPLAVLNPRIVPSLLLSLKQRLEAFAACGIRATVVIPFTRSFSRWTPRQFVERLLVKTIRVREAVVGHDFGFGAGRSGSLATLKRFGQQCGFQVHAIPPIRIAGQRVASHQIRDHIRRGDLNTAAQLLGRPVSVGGQVVRGTGRGKRLGFPTANLKIEAGILPPVGVYAVQAKACPERSRRVDSRCWAGMANIGLRPTFRGRVDLAPLLEVHLFGLRKSLYGRRLEVAFHKRLRAERRFPSPQALARQLSRDATRAQASLKGSAPFPFTVWRNRGICKGKWRLI